MLFHLPKSRYYICVISGFAVPFTCFIYEVVRARCIDFTGLIGKSCVRQPNLMRLWFICYVRQNLHKIFEFLGWHELMKLRQVVYDAHELTMSFNPRMHTRLLAMTYQLLTRAYLQFFAIIVS